MSQHRYIIKNNTISVLNYEEELSVYDFGNWESNKIKYYKSLLALKKDMEYAKAYLEQMFFGESTSLVDGALINSAIQLLVKCFSNPSGKGRPNLDVKKVFRTFAREIGEEDLTNQYKQFSNARNFVISHDQLNYKENIIGLVVNQSSGLAEDVAEITVRTRYLYRQNQQLLLRMINVVSQYIDSKIENLKTVLIEEYNRLDEKPPLEIISCDNIDMATEW